MEATLEQEKTTADAVAAAKHAVGLIDSTLKDIGGTSITTSSAMVDVLLDLRVDVDKLISAVLTSPATSEDE